LAAHEDSQLAANSHSPAIRKAWVKFVERRLGDVVSRNLRCLVNKLCEPPNQLLHRRLIAFLTSDEAKPAIQTSGMEPSKPR